MWILDSVYASFLSLTLWLTCARDLKRAFNRLLNYWLFDWKAFYSTFFVDSSSLPTCLILILWDIYIACVFCLDVYFRASLFLSWGCARYTFHMWFIFTLSMLWRLFRAPDSDYFVCWCYLARRPSGFFVLIQVDICLVIFSDYFHFLLFPSFFAMGSGNRDAWLGVPTLGGQFC